MIINGVTYDAARLIVDGQRVKIQFKDKSLMENITSLYKFSIEHKKKRHHVYVYKIDGLIIEIKKW